MGLLSTVKRTLRQDIYGRFRPGVWTMTVIGFLNAAALAISLPFLSLYLYQERGLTMTWVGVIILVSGICSAITQMYGGAISDRLGRRPLLLATVSISVLLYFGMAVLIQVSASVLAIVAVYTGVRSVLMMMRPAISASAADLTPKERLTEAYGLLRVGQNLGWAAGPAVGGYLAASLPYSWLFAFAGFIGVINLSFVFFLFRESFGGTSERISIRSLFSTASDRSFLLFTLLALFVFLVMAQMATTLSVFTVDGVGFSTSQYGLLLTLNGALVVLFQYPMSRATGRMAKSASLALGSLLYAFGYFSVSWVKSLYPGMLAMVVITSGEMVFSPTTLAVVGELSPTGSRGRYMGFFGLSETLGLALGPLLGGVLLDLFPSTPVLIWGPIGLVAFISAVGYYRWGLRRSVAPPKK